MLKKQTIYTVVRIAPSAHVIDSYATHEAADDRKTALEQQMFEMGFEEIKFAVHINVYYNL